jgi:hypothetical protein
MTPALVAGVLLVVIGVYLMSGAWKGYRSAKRILAEHDHECTLECLDEPKGDV